MLEDPKIVLKRQEIIDLKNKIKELEERNNYLDDYVCYLLGGYTEEEFMKLCKEKYADKEGLKC